MKDFGVVTARTILTVTAVAPIRDFLPPSLMVLGEKLNSASEILFNGVEVPEFVVASSSRLIVRIPDSQIGRELRSLRVFAKIPIPQTKAGLSLEISRPVRAISGVSRLVQAWLIIFFTNPGSDIFSPQSGGGGRAILGRTTDRNHKSAAADLALSIERTKTELLTLQTRSRNLPLSEKLLSSGLESISFDQATGFLLASVSIQNMLGDQAEVALR